MCHGISIITAVAMINNEVSLTLATTVAKLYPEIKPQASASELSEMVGNLLRWHSTVIDMEIPECYAQHRPARPPPHRLVRASSRVDADVHAGAWAQVRRCGTGPGTPRTPATCRPTCPASPSVAMVDRTAANHCARHARGGSVGASIAMVAARRFVRKATPRGLWLLRVATMGGGGCG